MEKLKDSVASHHPISREFAKLNLGDTRWNRRLPQLATKVATDPSKSFPQLFTLAELKSFYRMANSPYFSFSPLIEPHRLETSKRCAQHQEILLIHDTTEVSYAGKAKRKGLGRLRDKGQGFFAHLSLAASAQGKKEPLGIVNILPYTRSFVDEEQSHYWPFERKEQERWMMGVQASLEVLPGGCSAIHVMDREGDDYAIFAPLVESSEDFVIRICHDRNLSETLSLPDGQDANKLFAALKQVKAEFEREVVLSERAEGRTLSQRKHYPARDKRNAVLCVGAVEVSVARSGHASRDLAKSIRLNAVRVWEKEPPEGEKPIEWLLLTTLPIATQEELAKIVDIYRARWLIEEFNKALKTGCSLEKRRFESAEGLLKMLAFLIPIAWHLLMLRFLCREEPEKEAESVLNEVQLQILRQEGNLQQEQTTVRAALLAVAALGGHLKHNGEPGWIILTRGMAKLLTLERGWRAAIQWKAGAIITIPVQSPDKDVGN
jgi:hypothetical protein